MKMFTHSDVNRLILIRKIGFIILFEISRSQLDRAGRAVARFLCLGGGGGGGGGGSA